MSNPNGQQPIQSRLIVIFNGYGSADLDMSYENVTPMQLLAASRYLEWHALQKLSEQQVKKDQEIETKP